MGVPPGRATTTWARFLRSQSEALLAADLVETVTLTDTGMYILAVIEHATRRIRVLGATLRWSHVDLDKRMIFVRRAISMNDHREWIEKDVRSHQQRRAVIDPETAAVPADLKRRREKFARAPGREAVGC